MGRSILAEEVVQQQIDSFYGQGDWFIGLIIGQLSHNKDYVVHLAKTLREEDEAKKTDADGEEARKAPKKTQSLEDVREQWVTSNAKQILRMLPGGLDIIGVFAVAPPAMMQAAQTKLRQVLFAVQKAINKSEVLPQPDEITDRIVLQICATTRKLTCRTFDVADPKSAAKPAEWKYQSFSDQWVQVNATLSLDMVIPVSTTQLSQTLEKQIQTGLMPYCKSLNSALTTLNNQLLPPEEPLVSSHQSKKKKQKGDTSMTAASFKAQLFSHASSNDSSPMVAVTDCGAKLLVRGTVCARAHLNNKATAADATKCIKRDALRTLVSRCDLLCEDLLQTEEEQDPKVLYETPVRVFAPLNSSSLSVCDYMFQDEQASDSADRFLELLDLTVDPEKIDLEIEHVPDEEDLEKPVRAQKHSSIEEEFREHVHREDQFKNLAGLAFSGVAAAIAIGISYMYLGQE